MAILRQAADQGIQLDSRMYAPFPVAGAAYYSHDFGFPRYTPVEHQHEGTDIFAEAGTPVIATGAGLVVGFGDQAVGGLSVWIAGDDGSGFYYTHLSAFPPGLQAGARVEAGSVVGFVGNTGNAAGTSPHLHFEIHPPIKDAVGRIVSGGASPTAGGLAHTNTPAADPKPFLDAWLAEAEAKAQHFVDSLAIQYAEIPSEAHFARRVNEIFNVEEMERPGDLLWFSAQQVELGALGLARQAAVDARLSPGVGSIAQRTAEEQRVTAVNLAVQAPHLKVASFIGGESLQQVLVTGSAS